MKFIVTGALLSFLLTHEGQIPVSPFVVGSICAFLFDILLLENLGWIRSTGDFVKWKVEDESFQIRWEREFAQHSNSWQCFHPRAYLIGVWSVGFFLWCCGFVAVAFLRKDSANVMVDVFLLIVSFLFLVYSLFLAFYYLKYPTWVSFSSCWCRRRLKKIGKACVRYAIGNGGSFPRIWEDLKTDLDTSCYELVKGRKENDPPQTVLAYCREGSHKRRGANVLFVDGSVGWHPRRILQKVLVGAKSPGSPPEARAPRGRRT